MRDEIERLFASSFPGLHLDERMWRELLPMLQRRRLGHGSVLFCAGSRTAALFGVLSGEIEARFSTIDGEVSVIEHVGAGRLFGLAAFASGLPSSYEAVASRASRVLAIGSEAYDYLMDRVPGFARILMCEFAQRHGDVLQLLQSSRHHSTLERLSLALKRVIRDGRPIEEGDGRIFVNVSQHELAALSNLSRQTVNTLIAELCSAGHLRTAYRGLWLRSSVR